MNKTELIRITAKETKQKFDDVEQTYNTMVDLICDELSEGGVVRLAGFGIFKTRKREKRTVTNPSTKEKMELSEKLLPVFRAGKTMKERVSRCSEK